MALDVSVTDDIQNLGQFILIYVLAENIGNRSEVMVWKNCGLELRPVIRDDQGNFGYGDPIKNILGDTDLTSSSVEPGIKEQFSFSVHVSPGLYHVLFRCSVHSDLSDIENSHGETGVAVHNMSWAASKFIEVTGKQT